MSQNKEKLHLDFLRQLSEGPPLLQKLKDALKTVAPTYHLCGIEMEFIGEFEISDLQKEIMLFMDESKIPYGEPLRFVYKSDERNTMVFYVYPEDRDFSQDEAAEMEIYVSECFLYLQQIQLKYAVDNSAIMQRVTGLYNTTGYLEKIRELVRSGEHLTSYNALFLNINGFSEMNRRYGRKVGDILLKKYADEMRRFVADNEILCHPGSDNFAALIRKERQSQWVDFLAEVRIIVDYGQKIYDSKLSSTIGIWEIKEENVELEDVISRPSIAMNQAKHVLHQGVVYASDNMIDRIVKQKEVMENFADALMNEEFYVYYQPKVDSRTGLLVGAEGLVRWKHSNEMVSPGIFIPALEETGAIRRLDYYMLRHVCADIRRWSEEGYGPVPISVNFSRKDLADDALAENINEIIKESRIDRTLIEVELTETVDSVEIRTAIDDFGAGYSSLSTLREFQVNTLKIDRSFVNSDDFSWKDEIILRDVIHMAKELGMEIITEGVERDDQLAFVNSVGCFIIQGFYYDRPLPCAQFEERLKDKQYK